MKSHQHQTDPLPAAPETLDIPRDLVRQIARPDNQKLRIREVSPEHSKCQHELTDIVQMRGANHTFERAALPRKNHEQRNAKTKRRKPLPRNEQQAIDGG